MRWSTRALACLGLAVAALAAPPARPAGLPAGTGARVALQPTSGRLGQRRPAPPSPPAPSPSPPSLTPSPQPPGCVDVAGWSTARLAAQTVVVPVMETDVAAAQPEVTAGAGGVILFGSAAPATLPAALAALNRSAPGVPPLVMTDEEGGAVQRMANLVGSVPSARAMAATMTPAQVSALAETVGRRMRAAGVTVDLAPVVDLDGGAGPSNSDPDGTRSFSTDPATATADALAFATGLRRAGVLPVVKHFPGLGGATGNTDVEPASTPPWSTEQAHGLLPFEAAVHAGMPAVMVANASVPGLTAAPASLSPAAITGVLRQRLGFHGLVITDSLSAVAISAAGYTVSRATVAALAAGADMVLYGGTDPASVQATEQATVAAVVAAVQSGALARSRLVSAVSHVLAAKGLTACSG